VQAQGVSVQKRSTAILQIITLDSPGGTYDALYLSNYATINLVNELARLPGVGNVKVFGAPEMRCGSGWISIRSGLCQRT
jgi:HAE1 family hydrophobic/amphiphilic exporter-1